MLNVVSHGSILSCWPVLLFELLIWTLSASVVECFGFLNLMDVVPTHFNAMWVLFRDV